jgi:benzoyl-CoA reductase/2-hydroxyglutaryl-CoA dehydratase subunit BcrC/BadD/HgdB
MMIEYFDNLARGIEAKLASGPGPGETRARKRLALEIARLGTRLYKGESRITWSGLVAPYDLLHAMGVTPCFVEFIGGMMASMGSVEPMLQAAEQAGYATDCCTYHRSVTGAAYQGLMPEPDFLIATSAVCSGGMAVVEGLARHFGKDLFVVHVPEDKGEAGVRYLADQFRRMADFVADHTGEPLSPDRLRQAVENTNRTREALVQMYEYARRVPTPARRRDLVNFGIVMALFLGTEGGVEVAETYRDEFRSKVEAGIAGVPGEKIRLLWLQNRIQFKNPLEEMLEREYGAAVVADELNDVGWDPIDPDDPFPGFARRCLSVSLVGSAPYRLGVLERLARAYRVDGAINPCHWGCRQGTGARGLMEEGLKRAGVPVLNLEVDCVDPRNFSEGQLRTRLQAFVEMLGERKGTG